MAAKSRSPRRRIYEPEARAGLDPPLQKGEEVKEYDKLGSTAFFMHNHHKGWCDEVVRGQRHYDSQAGEQAKMK